MDSADNAGRFITQTQLNGLDPATLYHSRAYVGGEVDGDEVKGQPER